MKAGRWDKDSKPEENRQVRLKQLANLTAAEKKAYWRKLPKKVYDLHRVVDPYYVSDEERKAVAKLPGDVTAATEKLLSQNVEEYLAARRRLVAAAPATIALVADLARLHMANLPERLQIRLKAVLDELHNQKEIDDRLRISDAALKRAEELTKAAGDKGDAKIVALVSRSVSDIRVHPSNDSYGGLCYYSFPKGNHGYEGAVSLQFGNGEDVFTVRMYGGQENRIKDLGAVDFAGVKSAPNKDKTAAWPNADRGLKAVVGHVYLEHCLEPNDIDGTVKFKVLDLMPGEWVVIAWEVVPQDK